MGSGVEPALDSNTFYPAPGANAGSDCRICECMTQASLPDDDTSRPRFLYLVQGNDDAARSHKDELHPLFRSGSCSSEDVRYGRRCKDADGGDVRHSLLGEGDCPNSSTVSAGFRLQCNVR